MPAILLLNMRFYYIWYWDVALSRQEDKEVYCSSHVPKPGPGHLDGEAVGIRSALNVPRSAQFVNDQIRPGGRPSIDGDALGMKSPIYRVSVQQCPFVYQLLLAYNF